MKRLGQWIFGLVAGVSLLLCLATAMLWIRSYLLTDQVIWRDGNTPWQSWQQFQAVSVRGQLWLLFQNEKRLTSSPSPPQTAQPSISWYAETDAFDIEQLLPLWKQGNGGDYVVNLIGVSYSRVIDRLITDPPMFPSTRSNVFPPFFRTTAQPPFQRSFSQHLISLPYWLLSLCMIILPLAYARQWKRRVRRARTGHCPACGYDLRATPDRCPECGETAITHTRINAS